MADKPTQINADAGKDNVTNPKYSEANTPQIGGVSSQGAVSEAAVFKTTGDQPVRDRQPDQSKGTPVKRFFTKDGTPVEPTTVPTGVTPSNLMPPDENQRDDVFAVWEYLDEGGNLVSHNSLERKQEGEKKQA